MHVEKLSEEASALFTHKERSDIIDGILIWATSLRLRLPELPIVAGQLLCQLAWCPVYNLDFALSLSFRLAPPIRFSSYKLLRFLQTSVRNYLFRFLLKYIRTCVSFLFIPLNCIVQNREIKSYTIEITLIAGIICQLW